jgi:hypothetical protein
LGTKLETWKRWKEFERKREGFGFGFERKQMEKRNNI